MDITEGNVLAHIHISTPASELRCTPCLFLYFISNITPFRRKRFILASSGITGSNGSAWLSNILMFSPDAWTLYKQNASELYPKPKYQVPCTLKDYRNIYTPDSELCCIHRLLLFHFSNITSIRRKQLILASSRVTSSNGLTCLVDVPGGSANHPPSFFVSCPVVDFLIWCREALPSPSLTIFDFVWLYFALPRRLGSLIWCGFALPRPDACLRFLIWDDSTFNYCFLLRQVYQNSVGEACTHLSLRSPRPDACLGFLIWCKFTFPI